MLPTLENIYMFHLCLALLTLTGKCNSYWQQENETSRNLSEAIVKIVRNLFVQELKLRVFNFQVQLEVNNRKNVYFFDNIVDETMKFLGDDIGIRLGYGLPIPTDQERHYSVLLVDSKNSLKLLYEKLMEYHLNIEGSFFIILHSFPYANRYYDELLEIFDLNWRNGITHGDVLVHAVENQILLFHSMPFTPYHCKNTAPVIHNKFINGHWLNKEFIVAKTMNMHGCPLVCGTWEDMPYFSYNLNLATEIPTYMGLEGRLLKYLAEQMNFTVAMRWLDDMEINQTIYDEQGVFNKLFTNGTDFVIGSFRYKPTSLTDPYAPTSAYYMSQYYFVVSAMTDSYDPFTTLLLPFHLEIWLILIFIFVFGNTIVFIVTFINRRSKHLVLGRRNETPAYNMIIVSLGGGVNNDPKIPFSRFLLMLWLLCTFILRVVYQGLMFHFIRSDLHKPPPKVISDLLTEEYRLLMSEVVFNDITNLPKMHSKAEILNTSEVKAFDMLRHPLDYAPYKLAILTAYEYFGYYKYISPLNFDFYVVPQKVFTKQLTIYMKKNSAYLKRFNLYITNYINQGLISKWKHVLVYRASASKRKTSDETPRAMKISNLYGAYFLLLIGLILSMSVFVVEILVNLLNLCFRKNKLTWRKIFKKTLKKF